MDDETRRIVRGRAGNACEYCCLPQWSLPLILFHIEHIIAKQHKLDDTLGNLALACDRCNLHKGPNISSIDPESGELVRLYHPRRDRWSDRFVVEGTIIKGISPIGRATVRLLCMNSAQRVALRQELKARGDDA